MSALATIHTGLKTLGIDQEDARDLYQHITGKRSLRAMTPNEQHWVIEELRRRGFKKASNRQQKRLEGKFGPKLQALWIAGWNLGVFHDRTDAALIAFVRRQTGLDALRFLRHDDDARAAIDGIKGWIEREVGPVWSRRDGLISWHKSDGAKVASAQWSLLSQFGALPEPGCFIRYVAHVVGRAVTSPDDLTPRDWHAVMNQLGERVRKVRHG